MSNLLSQASLVMIPSGYKEDVVYSAVPTNGNGDLSFTRASNGTRINSAGLVEVVAWNLAQYSETFDNAGWVKDLGASVTANTTTAPNGTTTADTLNIASGQYMYQGVSLVVAQSYTISVYLRVASGTKQFKFNTYGSGNDFTSSAYTATTEWQRFDYTFTTIASGTTNIYPVLVDGLTGGAFYIWGAQLNIGSTAKPYFPTTDRLNVPRLTYQNGGGGCPSLLLEKQSTNLVAYSNDFSNAWWNKYTATVTANQTTSPDGTQNADKVLADAGTYGVIYTNQIFTVGQVITSSCYIKQGDGTLVNFGYTDNGADYYARFDVLNGTIVTTSGVTASIQSVGNGWYRCIITRTMAGNANLYIQLSDAGKYVYCWGGQSEGSSYATSLIETNGSSATRVADACFKTGISSLIGGGVGTWFMDFEFIEDTISNYTFAFNLSDGTTANHLYLYYNNPSWYWGGTDTGITLPSTLRKKIAIKYSSGTAKLFCNGSLISTLSISSSFSRLDIGNRFSQNYPMDGKINEAFFLTTSLTDAECQALTTI